MRCSLGQTMIRQQIGQMNGWWGLVFKVALATYPVVVAGGLSGGWWLVREVTANSYFREEGPRATRHDIEVLESQTEKRLADHAASPAHSGALTRAEMSHVLSRLDRMEDKLDRALRAKP